MGISALIVALVAYFFLKGQVTKSFKKDVTGLKKSLARRNIGLNNTYKARKERNE